jgi:hypothetical protein
LRDAPIRGDTLGEAGLVLSFARPQSVQQNRDGAAVVQHRGGDGRQQAHGRGRQNARIQADGVAIVGPATDREEYLEDANKGGVH